MSNIQNGFGTRNRPANLETASQIVRRRRLNKALRKARQAERDMKKLGITAPKHKTLQQSSPRPKKKKVGVLKRFGQWLTRKG